MADLLQTPQERLEREVVDWSNAVYEEAERGLADSREIKQASKLIDYLSGMQWNAKSRFGRSRPTVNRFFRHFVETVGLLTDIEPDFTVRFLQDDEESAQLQELMNEMIREWARMTDFEMELTQTVMWALVGANGYAKIQWNPNMNGGLGDVEFLPLGPLNVMTIGAGNRLQDEECVIARWPVTIEALFRTYGDLAKGVEADIGATETAGDVTRPAKIAPSSWVRLNPQLKKMLGQKGPSPRRTRYPRAMLKQFWFKDSSRNETSKTVIVGDNRYNWAYNVEPGELLYPRGRMIVVAGGKLLQDAPNPYWHGLIPFAKLRLIRVPWSEAGLTPLDPIALMQDIINRINGGIMDMIRASIEPKIIAPKAAFSQSVWDSLDPGAPGAKLQYNTNTPRPPEIPKPPELPAYVLTQKQDVEREQDATSGSSAINQALNKKQMPGGDSLDMIMNSRSIPIRFMGRGLTSFLTDVGTMVAGTKMQFETSKHRVQRFGAKGLTDADFEPYYGRWIKKGMKPEEFVRGVNFSIRKGSALSIEKAEEVQISFALRREGDLSRKGLYRKLGVPKNEELQIEKELLEEAQQKIMLAGEAGLLTKKPHK